MKLYDDEVFELQKIGSSDSEFSEFEIREINKFYSKLKKDASHQTKLDKCYICDKKCDSFCNSHSVSNFVLSNIAVDGKVYRTNKVLEISSPQELFGLKQVGTFRMICRDCDSVLFQNYENEMALQEVIDKSLLSEIALKNYLNEIYNKKTSSVMFDKMSDFSPMAASQVYPAELDVVEAESNAQYALNSIKGKSKGYYLFYSIKLNYTVPIAFQNDITLVSDLEGMMINNVYNFDKDYEQKNIHVCIFPLKDSTTILMFVKEGDKRYSKFRKQFKKLNFDEQLEVINYMIFLYSDEVYISPKIDTEILNNDNLKEVCSLTSSYMIHTNKPYAERNPIKITVNEYDLSKRLKIPNLLLKEFSI